jgi:hypothetical protein
MVNKLKAAKRETTRLRKTQNPQQADLRRKQKLRKAKTQYRAIKRKVVVAPSEAPEEKETKPTRAEEPEPEETEEDIEEDVEEEDEEKET